MVVSLPCPPIDGLVVSTTVMVWLTLPLVFPEQSVACQVRVNVPVPAQLPAVDESVKLMATLASQLSEAVGGLNTGVLGH